MKLVLRLRLLALQPLPSPHGGLPCSSRRALSSRTSPVQLAPRACLPVHWRRPAHPPTDLPVPAGGLFGAKKNTDLIHESTGICACVQDKNTDRYKQICTECRSAYVHVFRIRSAYLHVFRIKIQTDTYRYELPS